VVLGGVLGEVLVDAPGDGLRVVLAVVLGAGDADGVVEAAGAFGGLLGGAGAAGGSVAFGSRDSTRVFSRFTWFIRSCRPAPSSRDCTVLLTSAS
jgi:hypothetical protein